MIDKIEVGEKYINRHGNELQVLFIGEDHVVYNHLKNEKEYVGMINHALTYWNEIERETITLTEYICDCGPIRFLTDDLKSICYYTDKPNELYGYRNKDRCHKAPNARSYKVYADTLEPVDSTEY